MSDVPADDVASRARQIARGDEGHASDDAADAHRQARAILEESEERTLDPATVDPEDDSVIRRSSGETA